MKKRYTKTIIMGIVLTMIMAMALLFTSCGGPANLEEYIDSDADAKESIESMESTSTDGSGLSIDIEENTITYTYKYAMDVPDESIDAMKTELESAISAQSSTFTNLADTLEEESGISGISVKVVYVDADDTELYSTEF